MFDGILLNVWAIAVSIIGLLGLLYAVHRIKQIMTTNTDIEEGESKTVLIIQLVTTVVGLVTGAIIIITLPFVGVRTVLAILAWFIGK